MGKKQLALFCYLIAAICVVNFISCSKESPGSGGGGGSTPPVNPPDTCKTFTIAQSSTGTSPCSASGSIQVSATGSNQFMYKLNSGGTFQVSGNFTNVAAGNYTVYVKDSAGCQQTVSVAVSASAAGPDFANVKNLIGQYCTSCHNASNAPNVDGFDWTNQCSVIANGSLIQQEVDNGDMPYGGPPLSPSNKAIIDNWIRAGGGYSN